MMMARRVVGMARRSACSPLLWRRPALGVSSMSAVSDAIVSAEKFLKWDQNATTSAQAKALLDAAKTGDKEKEAELVSAFGPRLKFGTAGLRGVMGAGTSRMNDLTVTQAAQGLCAYLEDVFGEETARERGVAIGFDHRGTDAVNSHDFALYTAAVFLSKGFNVYLYDSMVATPLVPFAVEKLGCAAGVMVTASHNPRQDNGFKVYWDNGAQIIPPHDVNISSHIAANEAPWQAYDLSSVWSNPRCKSPELDGQPLGEVYIDTVASRLCRHFDTNAKQEVPIVYTAMHGVGLPWVEAAFKAFGLAPVVPVAEQVDPDPTFPTVYLPNPEEGKGALRLATETADRHGASVVLASDPDADRLAVAERLPNGEWHIFNGNDVGVMLGHWQWLQFHEANKKAGAADRVAESDVYMLAPAVASKMLAAIADTHGFQFEETLTGFKWAGNRTNELRNAGKTVLFAYEPEIGYCVGDVVKDKDGISAAAVFGELLQWLAQENKSVVQHFESLKDTYGHFVNRNSYLVCGEKATLDAIFGRLYNDGKYWDKCGRFGITAVRDLTNGVDTEQPDRLPRLPVDPTAHYLSLKFDNGATVTLRTSGTEPKLKYYTELRGDDPAAAQRELDEVVDTVIEEMLQPSVHNLQFPKEE